MRIGIGYDTHRLSEGRPLILGGVQIPFERGLLGHSDADCLTHAVIDALLGAAGLGDIGAHFPDTDPAYRSAASLGLLRRTRALVADAGYLVVNVDAVVVAQRPRLAPYLGQMAGELARALEIDPSRVNAKATSPEGLGALGREEAISAQAVALLETSRA